LKDYIVSRKKNHSSFYFQDFVRRHLNAKRIALILLFIIFLSAYFSFVQIELIQNQEVYNKIIADGKNPYFEGIYWIITTMATVGYGDVVPLSMLGKSIAMIVMLVGVTTIGLIASEVVSAIVSANFGELLGVNKISGKVDYLICGWNEVSNATLKELMQKRHRIVIIDNERRDELSKLDNVNFIKGNPVDRATLEKANIENTSTVILAMNNDSNVILAIHVIRELNPYVNIVAKINSHDNILLAENAGADHIVGPPVIGGKILWEAYSQPSVANWITNLISTETNYGFYEHDVSKDSTLLGKRIKELRKKLSGKAKLIGVDTPSGLEKVPDDEYEIKEGNKLILIINKAKFRGLE